MNTNNLIDLFFGGMEKLSPGGNVHTLHVLRLLPKQQFHVIVDAGCGAGRQTMVLARELDTPVHAVDLHESFLNDLMRRAKEAWVEGYYDILEPRSKALSDHPDSSVRDFAVGTIKEIEIFRCSEESYGYVFYILQRV